MAVAALTKTGLLTLRRQCNHTHHHRRLNCLWKTSNKHSVTGQVPSLKNNAANHFPHRLQSEWRSRFPNSITPKEAKPLDFSSPRAVPSAISCIGLSSSPKLGLMGWYLGMVKSKPIFTKSITAALIYTVADLSSQIIVGESSKRIDWARTLRMAAYGMLIIGPTLHYWFNFASRIFPKRDLISTVKKITLGQAVYGPAATAVFFSGNAALQGESGSEIAARLKRDLIPTLLNGIMYWPACDFVTFRFIPVHFQAIQLPSSQFSPLQCNIVLMIFCVPKFLQPLVSNSFSYVWIVYLTYMASLAKATM